MPPTSAPAIPKQSWHSPVLRWSRLECGANARSPEPGPGFKRSANCRLASRSNAWLTCCVAPRRAGDAWNHGRPVDRYGARSPPGGRPSTPRARPGCRDHGHGGAAPSGDAVWTLIGIGLWCWVCLCVLVLRLRQKRDGATYRIPSSGLWYGNGYGEIGAIILMVCAAALVGLFAAALIYAR